MNQPDNVTPLKIANAEKAIRHVFVRDLLLDAHIGAFKHEIGSAQPVRVNVDLTVSEAAHGDDLRNVVCYATVVDSIKAIVSEGHLNLVETLAERIAASCLEDLRVQVALVRVEKLAVIPEASSVGVEIERRRHRS